MKTFKRLIYSIVDNKTLILEEFLIENDKQGDISMEFEWDTFYSWIQPQIWPI